MKVSLLNYTPMVPSLAPLVGDGFGTYMEMLPRDSVGGGLIIARNADDVCCVHSDDGDSPSPPDPCGSDDSISVDVVDVTSVQHANKLTKEEENMIIRPFKCYRPPDRQYYHSPTKSDFTSSPLSQRYYGVREEDRSVDIMHGRSQSNPETRRFSLNMASSNVSSTSTSITSSSWRHLSDSRRTQQQSPHHLVNASASVVSNSNRKSSSVKRSWSSISYRLRRNSSSSPTTNNQNGGLVVLQNNNVAALSASSNGGDKAKKRLFARLFRFSSNNNDNANLKSTPPLTAASLVNKEEQLLFQIKNAAAKIIRQSRSDSEPPLPVGSELNKIASQLQRSIDLKDKNDGGLVCDYDYITIADDVNSNHEEQHRLMELDRIWASLPPEVLRGIGIRPLVPVKEEDQPINNNNNYNGNTIPQQTDGCSSLSAPPSANRRPSLYHRSFDLTNNSCGGGGGVATGFNAAVTAASTDACLSNPDLYIKLDKVSISSSFSKRSSDCETV